MKNARMDEFDEHVYAASTMGRGLVELKNEFNQEKGWRSKKGVVQHPLGFVLYNNVKSWPTEHPHSAKKEYRTFRLEVIHNGKVYYRFWSAWYGNQTIARLANEFIEEIKGENP